jgi:hypothetical protein
MRASWSPFPFTVYVPSTLGDCPPSILHRSSSTPAPQTRRSIPGFQSLLARAVFCTELVFYPLVLFQSRLLRPETHLPYPSTVMSGANLPASNSRQGFGRGGNNKNQPPKSPAQTPQAPQPGAIPNSQSLTNSLTVDNLAANDPDAPKYFFQEKYAPLNVRGNFLTLCACPKNVELGEWLAHQSELSRG